MMGSSPVRQTTTEQDETAGDIEINDPAGMYGSGKGKRLFEMSEKELKALGFSPKKIKEIMADGAKNPMSQEEVLEDIKTQELEQQNKNEYILKNIFIWSN
jgi:hypothetical protein